MIRAAHDHRSDRAPDIFDAIEAALARAIRRGDVSRAQVFAKTLARHSRRRQYQEKPRSTKSWMTI